MSEFDRLPLLFWIGARLTLFFRKKFNASDVWPTTDIVGLAMAIVIFFLCTDGTFDLLWLTYSFLEVSHRLGSSGSSLEMVKSVLLACSLYLTIKGSVTLLCWIAVCVMATTQLLRWPMVLKISLRKLRTVCGPSYATFIIGAYYKEASVLTNTEEATPFPTFYRPPSLLKCAALCSCFASMLFRPDNQQLWSLIPFSKELIDQGWIPAQNRHKAIHAGLMLFSYFCMVSKYCLLDLEPPFRLAGATLIILSLTSLIMGTSSFHSIARALMKHLRKQASLGDESLNEKCKQISNGSERNSLFCQFSNMKLIVNSKHGLFHHHNSH